MKIFLMGLVTTLSAILFVAFVILLEAVIHLSISFIFVGGADLLVSWLWTDLVPTDSLALVTGIGAVISYILARINKMTNKG